MILPLLADLALLVAVLFAWRVSRIIAVTLSFAVAASLVHAATSIEALRWASALVGLVGAVELGRRAALRWVLKNDPLRAWQWAKETGVRPIGKAIREGLQAFAPGRPDALAVLCLASMAGDGAAYLAWERLAEWVQPAAQLVMSGLVIAVCVWPRRRTS